MKKPTNLTVKQQKFVKSVVQTGNASESVLDAGYNVTSKESTAAVASNLLRHPKIKSAICELLDQLFPDLDRDAASWLSKAIKAPISGSSEDTGVTASMSWSEKKSYLEFLAKIKDWEAPRKTRNESLFADVTTRFAPPKE